MIWGVFHQHVYETRWSLAPGLDLVLHADALSVLFVTLSTVLWLVTTVYAIGYLETSPHRSRFFGFLQPVRDRHGRSCTGRQSVHLRYLLRSTDIGHLSPGRTPGHA